ncbi:MAG: hypothetical protein K9K33_19090 [Desulfarculaceae bacterium]|nr:hypothetical protein [Desulfarculaceae bacterium]
MIKRIIIIGLSTLVVTVAVLLALLNFSGTTERLAPWQKKVTFPIKVVIDGAPSKQHGLPNAVWNIFISNNKEDAAPIITVKASRGVVDEGPEKPFCEFDVIKLVGRPLIGTDWRMGHVIKDLSPYRDKTVILRMKLKADKPVDFSSASVYLYDGASVKGVSVKHLDQSWKQISLKVPVSQASKVLEVWLRLAIHGTISTKAKIYMADVELDVK